MEMMADGMTLKEILGAFPDLEAGDIDEALQFAADAVSKRRLPLVDAGSTYLEDRHGQRPRQTD
jgi:hypothetical protein